MRTGVNQPHSHEQILGSAMHGETLGLLDEYANRSAVLADGKGGCQSLIESRDSIDVGQHRERDLRHCFSLSKQQRHLHELRLGEPGWSIFPRREYNVGADDTASRAVLQAC